MEISYSSNLTTDDHIATTFGTCHDSPAVVPCAKYCSDHFISIWMRAKWNFHHIWNVMEKLLVKCAPDPYAVWFKNVMLWSWLRPSVGFCCYNALGPVQRVHQIPRPTNSGLVLPVRTPSSCIVTTSPSKLVKQMQSNHNGIRCILLVDAEGANRQ